MPKPPIPEGWILDPDRLHLGYFGECGDYLHLIIIYGPDIKEFDIYEMEKDYSGWFVKYRVDLDAITAAFPEMVDLDCYMFDFNILCVVREANDEDSYMVLRISDKAIQYNLKDGSLSSICDLTPYDQDYEGIPFASHVAVQFIPTLFHLTNI
ncbi:hypothetical protein COLO4_37349 [Corchorus olitorius]|uniref:F-box protein n=1 Tax=Corchorus olitorius TaxID=93759 RepID=A0A1R3G2G7_9ROSI|nr:hypothetical protein COLO4_37349 [Corchorus olitorius]